MADAGVSPAELRPTDSVNRAFSRDEIQNATAGCFWGGPHRRAEQKARMIKLIMFSTQSKVPRVLLSLSPAAKLLLPWLLAKPRKAAEGRIIAGSALISLTTANSV